MSLRTLKISHQFEIPHDAQNKTASLIYLIEQFISKSWNHFTSINFMAGNSVKSNYISLLLHSTAGKLVEQLASADSWENTTKWATELIVIITQIIKCVWNQLDYWRAFPILLPHKLCFKMSQLHWLEIPANHQNIQIRLKFH